MSSVRSIRAGRDSESHSRLFSLAGVVLALLMGVACADDVASLPASDARPLTILTAQLPEGAIGQRYEATVAATGGAGTYRWSIQSGRLPRGLVIRSSGTPSTVITGTPVDIETARITIRVEDELGQAASQTLSIAVRDGDPAITIPSTTLPTASVGESYTASVSATNAGPGPHRWSLVQGSLPGGLMLAPEGPAATIVGVPLSPGRFQFSLSVENGDLQRAQASFAIDVVDDPLVIFAAELPAGGAGVPYVAVVEAQGGCTPLTWEVVSGALPSGIVLEASVTEPRRARLTGTPNLSGVYSFRIRVSDCQGRTAERAFFVVIERTVPLLRIVTMTLPDAVLDQPYDEEIITTDSQSALMWSIEQGALPPGLTLTPDIVASARITGRPTAVGRYEFVVRAEEAATERTAFMGYEIRVVEPTGPLRIVTSSIAPGQAGQPFSAVLVAAGGVPPYNWVVTGSELPPGLSLDVQGTPSTQITGVPTVPGAYTFSVTVFDLNNTTATRTFTLVVDDE